MAMKNDILHTVLYALIVALAGGCAKSDPPSAAPAMEYTALDASIVDASPGSSYRSDVVLDEGKPHLAWSVYCVARTELLPRSL